MEDDSKVRAENMVLQFVKKRRYNKDGVPVARTLKALRSNFESLKMSRIGAGLDVDFLALIDEMIELGRLAVTNNFVWVPRSQEPQDEAP